MTAFNFHKRRTRRRWYAGVTLMSAAFFAVFFVGAGAAKTPPPSPAGPYQVPTGPIGQGSGFADNDGGTTQPNVTSDYSPSATVDPNATNQPTTDWNSLASNPSYSDTSADQYGEASGTTSDGWQWVALNDAAVSTTDTSFAGGVKQDFNCPVIDGSKAPNKDDLKRAYLAFKTLANGHTILNLAWVRIPQNTTSSSAHIGFEFNQSTTACGSTSDGLVQRTAGDLLLVYDFTGGSTVPPTINLSRWVTGASDTCQVGSDSPTPNGCWGTFTALSSTEAEANVDTGLNHICNGTTGCNPGESDHNTANTAGTRYVLPFQTSDNLAPTTENLGTSEFGEAGVDLTNAGVFTAGSCESFGRAYAVSRSSGDSNTAAMEDLVGPGKIHLSNCTSSGTTQMQSSSDNNTFANMSNGAALSSGAYVRDKSTVTVTGTSTWAGNVDFYLCYNASTTLTGCDSTGTNNPTDTSVTPVGGDVAVCNTGGTCSPSNGPTATSESTQLSASGSYCWAAEFTSTSPDGLPDATATTTECFSATSPTSIKTNPFFYPQDRVTISASSGGDLAGKVSWRLYDSSADCTANVATVAGGLLYSETPASNNIAGASPQSVNTSNTMFRVTTTTPAMYWRVSYHSTNGNQTDSSSVCVENLESTITADGSVTFP